MDAIKLGHATNSDVYLDGARHIGRIKKFEMEGVSYETIEHAALGMIAKVELPGRTLEPIKGTLAFEWLDRDTMVKVARPNKTVRLQLQTYVDVFDQDGVDTAQGYRLIRSMDLMFVKGLGASAGNGEAEEMEMDVTITRFAVTTSKSEKPIQEISVYDGINRVDGADVWPNY